MTPSYRKGARIAPLLHLSLFLSYGALLFRFSCPPLASFLVAPLRAFLPRTPPFFCLPLARFLPPLATFFTYLAFLTTPSLFSWLPIAFSTSPPLLQPKQFLRLCVMKLVQNVCVALYLKSFSKNS